MPILTRGANAQTPLEVNSSPVLNDKGIKQVQKIVGSILYYARGVDMTVLMALSAISVKQTKAMVKTMGKCIQLLDYLASNSEAKVRYYSSDMIMNIHSDASYQREAEHADILSWDGCHKMVNPSKSTVHSM